MRNTADSPSTEVVEAIKQRAAAKRRPDGAPYASIAGVELERIAAENGCSARDCALAALEQGIIPERYARNFAAYSLADQIALLQSRVLLVGLGGLGGSVLEILARAGVGNIIAADGDHFEESNLNRQLLATSATIGLSKSQAAAQRVALVNPDVVLRPVDEDLTAPSMVSLASEVDIVVDALGGLECRPSLWQAATAAGVPMVSAAVAGQGGCIGSYFPGDAGPGLLFGACCDDKVELEAKKDAGENAPAEDYLGTQAPAVHLAASLQASEVLRLLVSEEKEEGRVLFFDLEDFTFEKVKLGF